MRFTLLDLGDVEVPDGTPLGEARPGLARLTGAAALARAPLEADGHALPDGLRAGVAPWVAGARVGVGTGGPAGAAVGGVRTAGRAVRRGGRAARWWVVSLDGPLAGRAEPLATARPVVAGHVRAHGWSALAVTRVPAPRGPARAPVSAWTWLVPAAGAAAAALVWHSPALAVLSLVGVLPAVAGLRPARRRAVPRPARVGASLAAATPRQPTDGDVLGGPPAERPGAVRGGRAGSGSGWWDAAGQGLALCGPRPAALAAARVLVADALADPETVVVLVTDGDRAEDWRWLRWCADRVVVTAARGARAPAPTGALVLVDVPEPATVDVGPEACVVLAQTPPVWCRVRVAARALPHASPAWAEGHARALAARGGRTGAGALPAGVALADLPVEGPGAWAVPIGTGPTGPVHVDLVADGPHVLVAGTTGAGKSELLQTLVLSLARRHGPDRLALVLVDFKGGAGLGACRGLPHVAGLVTDLDPDATTRVLEGLRAEVRAREALLAGSGAADLESLRTRGGAPPRVVVVVDELLALRDDLPGALPALVRLATQGRALGLHLVLATQRPAGALDPQVRANVALRVCLRVADPADSLDVVGTTGAAALPARTPGRALLRAGEREPVELQVAWAALEPSGPDVRWAPPWPPDGTGPAAEHLPALVADVAARHGAGGRATPLWRPALPRGVRLDAVADLLGRVTAAGAPHAGPPPAHIRGSDAGLVIGVVDRPTERATDPLVWRTAAGPLVVVGPAGSGRSTALRTAMAAAARSGAVVHLVRAGAEPARAGGPAPAVVPVPAEGPARADRDRPATLGDLVGPERLGTVVDVRDPRRVLRLLDLLTAGATHDVLAVDDVGLVVRALRTMPRGIGEDAWAALLASRVPLALAGDERDLRTVSAGLLVRLGELPGGGPLPEAVPGRGVAAGASCQVAHAGPDPGARGPGHDGGDSRPAPRGALRLAALPEAVDPADLPPGGEGAVLGLGGDDAGPVRVALDRGLLVVGPAGSGRTSVLRHLARVVPGARLLDAAALAALRPGDGPGCAHGSAIPGTDALAPGRSRAPEVLLVDDADVALRDLPDADEALTDLVAAAERSGAGPRVVLVARTDRAALAFRGAVAALRGSGAVLVLDPLATGSADASGADLARACDPRRVRGRAALVARGAVTPVQLALAP